MHNKLLCQDKQLIELLIIELETVKAKIQLQVNQSMDDLFPDESQDVRTALEEKSREMKKNNKRQEITNVYGKPRLWILYTKNRLP